MQTTGSWRVLSLPHLWGLGEGGLKATEDDRGRGMTAVAGIGGSWQFSNNPRDTQFSDITLYTLVYNQTYIKARTHATALWILRTVWSFTTAGYTIFPTKAVCSRLNVWRSLISVAITEIAATWREPHPHQGSTSTAVGVILLLLPVFRFRDEPPIITGFFWRIVDGVRVG